MVGKKNKFILPLCRRAERKTGPQVRERERKRDRREGGAYEQSNINVGMNEREKGKRKHVEFKSEIFRFALICLPCPQ